MKHYFINDFEVHRNTFMQCLDKEFKRMKANCHSFDESMYKVHNKIILNDIKFEIKEELK